GWRRPQATGNGAARGARKRRGCGDWPSASRHSSGAARGASYCVVRRSTPDVRLGTRALSRGRRLRLARRALLCRKGQLDQQRRDGHRQVPEAVRLGTNAACCQPVFAADHRKGEMLAKDEAGIGNKEKKGRPKIKGRRPTHAQPETPRSPQDQREDKAG